MGMHRLLAVRDARLQEIPVVIMTEDELRSIGFTDSEIDNDPCVLGRKVKVTA